LVNPLKEFEKNKNPWFLAILVHFRTDFHCSKNFNDALYLSKYEYLSHPKLVFNVCPNLTLNCSCGIYILDNIHCESIYVSHMNQSIIVNVWPIIDATQQKAFIVLLWIFWNFHYQAQVLHITTTLTSSKIWHTSHFTITTRDTRN